jgi:hypothetical protein
MELPIESDNFKTCRYCGVKKFIESSFKQNKSGGYSVTCIQCLSKRKLMNRLKKEKCTKKCGKCKRLNCLNDKRIMIDEITYVIKCKAVKPLIKTSPISTLVSFDD